MDTLPAFAARRQLDAPVVRALDRVGRIGDEVDQHLLQPHRRRRARSAARAEIDATASASAVFSRQATISSVSLTTSASDTGPSFSFGLRAKLRRCRLIEAMRSVRLEMRETLSRASPTRSRSIRIGGVVGIGLDGGQRLVEFVRQAPPTSGRARRACRPGSGRTASAATAARWRAARRLRFRAGG